MGYIEFPSNVGGIPGGNTANRPLSPVIGKTFYNGQLGQLEIYNGTSWTAVSAPALAPTLATPTSASNSDDYTTTAGKLSVVFTRNPDGGEPIKYNAYTTAGGFSASSSSNIVTITGLTPGTAYSVYGNVQNNFGLSVNSANTASATSSTKPQVPTIGTANSGNVSASLTFTAGNNGNSSITNYKYSIDGTTYIAFSPAQTTSPLSISGLTNGVSYLFYLKAVNANGDSPASAASNSVIPASNFAVDYLVVAGGGGGGGQMAGGGGAGGMRCTVAATGGAGSLETALSLALTTNYIVTIGAGSATGANYGQGANGNNSIFSTITSTGGGGGGGTGTPGSSGGSGGGGGGSYYGGNAAGGAASPSNQGFVGGFGHASNRSGGGGGGASAQGVNDGGAGGDGRATTISGSSTTYAGGGGGGNGYGNFFAGGTGGGGSGGATNGGAGGVNTGGGGGGYNDVNNGASVFYGGTGGSGVIILRYPDNRTITLGAGVTGTTPAASGGFKVTTITAAGAGNTVSWV